MADLLFTLKSDLDEDRREAILAEIRALPGVEQAAPINRDASSPRLRRLCFARLSDEAHLDELKQTLQEMGDVETVERPAGRHL